MLSFRPHRFLVPNLMIAAMAFTLAGSPLGAASETPPPLEAIGHHAMLEARLAPAAVAAGDFIYIIGGSNRTTPTLDSVERLDLRTGRSEQYVRLRIGRVDHRAVLVGSRIYVLGGRSAFGSGPKYEASVEIIDLTSGEVSRGPDLPDAKASFACVAVGDRILVIGGQRSRSGERAWTNTVQVLDTGAGTWTEAAPMPAPRETNAVVVDGGFVVVPGGYNGRRAVSEVEVFNPREGRWSSIAPLPEAVSAHALAFAGRNMYLVGEYRTIQQLMVYDLVTKRATIHRLKEGARFAAALVHQEMLYVVGGETSRDLGVSDRIAVFRLADPILAH
jgi:hypothetical protein